MELKQLEYFMIACEKRSFNKAAECLYTTQPNVNKKWLILLKRTGKEAFWKNKPWAYYNALWWNIKGIRSYNIEKYVRNKFYDWP